MDNIKIIIPRNEVVIVRDDVIMFTTLQEGERLVDQGNFNNCKEPKWDEETQDFIEGAVIVVDLEALKQTKLRQIEASAVEALKTFTYQGLTFENSGDSKSNLMYTQSLMGQYPTHTAKWRVLNGTYQLGEQNSVVLDVTNIMDFAMAMAGKNGAVIDWQDAAEEQLTLAMTEAEINAVSTEYNG